MKLKVLGSSSSGNCYLIEINKNEKLILDAGINFKDKDGIQIMKDYMEYREC